MEPEQIDAALADADALGYATFAIKSVVDKATPDDPGRFFSGMLNANSDDLEGERYEPAGIDTKAFMAAGGPILARHFGETTPEGYSTVVARALSVSRRDDGLFINKAEFDTDLLSEHYKGKVQRGFIKCMSAGFLRLEVKHESKAGRQIRVVTKSMLVHGILTSQPVNRQSLIGRKSLERVEQLARDLEALKIASVPAEQFKTLSESIGRISEQLQDLSLKADRTPEPLTIGEYDPAILAIAEMTEEAYKAAHPELPDAAFIIEQGAERENGKVLRKYRHLPHHTSAVKSPTEHTSVNKALLRNALARCNQVTPAKEDAAGFRAHAQRHLRAHANALGIGKE